MSETREAYSVKHLDLKLDVLAAQVLGWRWVASKNPNDASSPFYRFIFPPDMDLPSQWHPAKGDEPLAGFWDKWLPYCSRDLYFSMQAWEWLENNNPWKGSDLALMRNTEGQPAVYRIHTYDTYTPVASGQTYPHAIALAVVEAGKIMGLIDNAPNL